MTALATLPVLLGVGIHSARPAAADVGSGGLYSCTTHDLVYQTDGSSWTTWATLGSGGGGAQGTELDYVAITSPVTVTATTEAGATTVVTGSAVAYDGSTDVMVEYWFPYIEQDSNTNSIIMVLYDGSSSIGYFGILTAPASGNLRMVAKGERRITPSAATHTYSIRAFKDSGTASVGAGSGAAANHPPGFIRIVQVTP